MLVMSPAFTIRRIVLVQTPNAQDLGNVLDREERLDWRFGVGLGVHVSEHLLQGVGQQACRPSR